MRYPILIFIIFIISCQEESEPIPFESTLQLPAEYQYDVELSCFCLTTYIGPHRLHIRKNEILSYELLNTEELVDSSFITSFTIDSLYSQVEDFQAQNPVVADIVLHPIYKFPIRVYFDVSTMIADEEWGYEITNFEVLED